VLRTAPCASRAARAIDIALNDEMDLAILLAEATLGRGVASACVIARGRAHGDHPAHTHSLRSVSTAQSTAAGAGESTNESVSESVHKRFSESAKECFSEAATESESVTETAWDPVTKREPSFLAYSLTKTLTACLVLGLREEGALALDDTIERWVPRVPESARVTIRHLLNHTAGIPDYGGNAAYHDALRASPLLPWTAEQFAEATYHRGLLFAPGTGWAYSNVGYLLLKQMLERVTGQSFRTLVADRIARPLSLDATFVAESPDDLAGLAPGLSTRLTPDGSALDVRTPYHPGWVSHGVVVSSASDSARFIDALFHGGLLPPPAVSEMMQAVRVPAPAVGGASAPVSPLRFGAPAYGLGLMIDSASPWGTMAGHNGGGPCYSASVFHVVGRDVTVCAMGAIETGFNAEGVVAQLFNAETAINK
jgi:D-alanyl-D-alanine carboxypeptidase